MQRKTVVGILQTACLLGVLTSNLMASDPLDTWTWRNPLPNATSMNGVTYGAGLIVGVGNTGTIMTSTNLTTASWVQSPLDANVQNLKAIAYSPDTNLFVVVGDATGVAIGAYKQGMILTSTDATNWYTQSWTNTNTRNLMGVAYGAGRFVAVGQRSGIWTSPDGTNWTQTLADKGSSYNLNAITYRPDVGFVAVGDANSSLAEVETSPDGITWTVQTTGVPANSLNGITWGYVTNGDLTVTTNFVAVGGKDLTEGTIATSPNGITWTAQASYTTRRLYAAAFNPGVGYIAVGMGGAVQTSVDGALWEASYSDLSLPGNDFKGATYAADLGYFIGVGTSGMVETSPTGVPATWTGEFSGHPENLTGVARGSVNFVVVGNNLPISPNFYGLILTSSDGVGWRVRNSATPPSIKLNNVAYGAGTFVAVGNGGTIVTSSDEGTNWTAQTSGVIADLRGVSYITNSVTNIFIVTGTSGTILTSSDGITWTVQTSGVVTALYCSCPTYAAGVYVVGGAGGVFLTSPDAATWTAQASGITRDINSLAYATNNFVAACSYGYILTSPAAITWTRQISPFGSDNSSSRTYYTVVYANGSFVMAGSTSAYACAIQSSTDGTNWVIRPSPPTGSSFKTLAYAPDTYLGVGNGGMIMQAGALLVTQPQILLTYETNVLTLTWSGGGTLQASSPDVAGPYTNVPGAFSPWSITPLTEPRMYFRVQQP
jgi:hypothetical protein